MLKGIEEFVENCSGNVIDLLQYESGIQIYDNCVELIGEPCFNGFAWFENESLTMPVDTFAEAPFNPTNSFTHPNPGSCSPENITLYVGFYCTLDGFVSGPYFAGTLTISTFPSYDESLITVLNEGDCDNFPPNVVSQCLGWTIEADDSNPDDIKPGESGDYLFNVVQYNLTGDECFNEPFSVPYECPPICEEFDLLNSVPATACNGDTITLKTTVSTIEDTAIINSDYSVQWYKNGTAIAGATALKYVATFNAVGCDPVTDWYSVTYTCIKPGNSTITLNADTVTIYPEYDPDFIEVAPYFLCEAPTIEVNCDNYTATLVASPDAIGAGDYVWEISYSDTTGQSCWNEVYEVSTFYTCTCPTIPNNYNDDIAICADDVLNLGAISNLLPDPIGGDDVTYGGYAWFLDAAYTQPFPNNYGYNGDNCTAFKDTLYVAYQCAAAGIDTLLLPAGVLQVTIYPPYDATLMSIDTAECEVPQLLSSCSEYLIAPVDVPTSVEPGDTGVAVFQIQYGDAPTCWTETYPVDYYCPYIPVCPLINTPLDETLALCSTSVFDFSDYEAMIDSSDIDNTGIEYLWFTNAALTQVAGSESSFQHSGADNCEAESITLYIGLRCSLQNELIPAGSLQLVMYPDYDVSFITPSAAGECTVPSITVNCDNYIITPDPANITQFEPGTSGTNSWTISFDGGPNDNPCFSNVYTLPYQCPPCPEVSVSSVPQDICSGESITLQATVTPANAIFGLDYEVQWYDNGAPIAGANTLLEVIDLENENCDPETHIYTLQFTCLFPITETQSIDVGTVLVNPAYNDTFVTLSNTADCEAPTLTSACDNYTITPNANNVNVVLPNSSGTNSWTITYNGSNCFSENISEDYECPACPTATAAAPPTTVCSGETITLSAVISPADAVLGQDYALQWLDNGVPRAGATTAAYDINTMNNTCDTETHNYTLAFNCLFPENTTTDITAGSVIVTPAYNADFINTNNAVCAVPTLTGTCDNYFIVPQNVPAAVLPDESGTAVWQISYSGSDCWTEDVSIDYACACPTVTTPAAGTLTLCNGEQPDLATLAAQIQFTDPANLTTSVQWYSDATLTTPFAPALLANTACDPLQVTIYAGITCFSATPTPIAAGQVAITVYPSFNASFIQKNAGDCANPILSSTCNQYVLTPDVGNSNNTTIPGNSGFWNWTITYNGSDCFSVQDSVPFVCGAVCPTVSLGSIPISLCNGEILSLSAEVVPSGAVLGTDFEVQWLQNGQPVAGANDLTYQVPLTASGCNFTAYTFELLFTCLNPGAPAQTFNVGTVNVFPDYDSAFINEYNTACTVPQIEATCSSYSINVVNVPAQVLAGDNGTATWQITYNNNNCWTETYSVAYDCPFVPGCPLVTNPLNGNINLCIGESPDFAALSNQIQYNDPDNLAGTINFYTDNALTNIATAAAYTYSGDGCAPQNVTLYAGLQCNATTPTVLAAGSVLLTLYPNYNADFISENAPLCAVPQITSSCNNYSITATNVPAQVLAGDNGTATWQITYNNNNCWTETYSVAYDCPFVPGCPLVTNPLNGNINLCIGESPDFAALSNQIQYNDPDNLAGTINFYTDNALTNIATAAAYTYSGDGCAPQNVTLYAGLECNVATPTVLAAGSVLLTLYPDYNADFISENAPLCAVPQITSSCNNYSITATNVPAQVLAGDNGTATWQITYNNSTCWTETYNVNYSCAAIPLCPVITQSLNTSVELCYGAAPDFATLSNQIQYNDPDNLAGNIIFYSDAALNNVVTISDYLHSGNNTCNTENITLYAGLVCENTPQSIIPAGSVTCLLFPEYDASLLTAQSGNDCEAPTLNTTCPNYIITPSPNNDDDIQNGESGNFNWTITYNDGVNGQSCFEENYTAPYTCGEVCPVVSISVAAPATACSGETITMTAAISPANAIAGIDYSLQWYQGNFPIPLANGLQYAAIVTNTDCETSALQFSLQYTCLNPGAPPQTLDAGTTIIYPDYNQNVLQEVQVACQVPQLNSTCNNYIITPVDVPSSVNAGDSGTAVWQVTYESSGCWSENYSYDYNIPLTCATCPSVTTPISEDVSLCSGTAPDLLAAAANLVFDDPDNTAGAVQWFSNAALTTPVTAADWQHSGGDNCEVETVTLFAALPCSVPPASLLSAGTITLTLYPDFDAALLTETEGDCEASSLISTCANYILTAASSNISGTVQAGESGINTWTVTFSGNNCFSEEIDVFYSCGEVCPQLADIDLQNITLCSGEAIILNDLVSVLPATAQLGTDYSLQWYINGVEVSGATAADFSYTQTTNTNCEPEILNVSLKFTCLVPAGNAPQTISVAQVSVYPAFNNELLISGDGQCQLPQLSSSCAQYQISIVGTPPQVAAGDTGVVQYNITYAANACFNEILSLNYLCPEIPPTKEIYIPTAFSPNNDNVNDIFRALSNYPLSEFNMMIYNRWGNLVFSSNDISIGWNGYTATDENDMEVFVYYCNVTFDDGEKKTYKGNVTLVR
ncbi:MAG: gliding motility-associated C-terminal domain-containing protein [Sphingobacteriales bacterium]|nr:gliding motility-associated C-terminal domain-containing protein [Sphingobacteriales bacterium]